MNVTQEETLLKALEELQQNGYTCNFVKNNDYLYCSEKDMNFRSYELTITEKCRYEDKNEPSKNSVLYAIESPEFGLKGFLLAN